MKRTLKTKKSPIGWFPAEWNVFPLGSVTVKIGSGVTPKGGESSYLPSGIPLIRSQNVLWGKLDLSDVAFIPEAQHATMSGTKVQMNDVLLNITGASIGRASIFAVKNQEANVNQHVCIIRPNGSLESLFLCSLLISPIGQKQIDSYQGGGNREGLNFEQIRNFYVPLPPLPEQRKIAAILSTWDRALEKMEALVVAKRRFKRGMMQLLLTGSRRFFGYHPSGSKPFYNSQIPGDWAASDFSDVFEFLRSFPFPREDLTDEIIKGGVQYIHYGDIHARFQDEILDLESESLPFVREGLFKQQEIDDKEFPLLNDGDLIIADVSEDYEGVGECVELHGVNGRKVVAGLHTFVARDKGGKTSLGLRTYLLRHQQVVRQLRRIATGISVYGISKSTLAKVKLALPLIPEQKRIADCLHALDSEISLLEKKAAKIRKQKEGLMQKLLTGSVQVKV